MVMLNFDLSGVLEKDDIVLVEGYSNPSASIDGNMLKISSDDGVHALSMPMGTMDYLYEQYVKGWNQAIARASQKAGIDFSDLKKTE